MKNHPITVTIILLLFLAMAVCSFGCKKETPRPTVAVRYEVQSSLQPFYFTTMHPDNTVQGDSIHQVPYALELQYDGARTIYDCDVYTTKAADIHIRIFVDGVLKGDVHDSLYAHASCHTN